MNRGLLSDEKEVYHSQSVTINDEDLLRPDDEEALTMADFEGEQQARR